MEIESWTSGLEQILRFGLTQILPLTQYRVLIGHYLKWPMVPLLKRGRYFTVSDWHWSKSEPDLNPNLLSVSSWPSKPSPVRKYYLSRFLIVLKIYYYYSNPLKDYITEKRTGRFKRTSKVRKLMDHISLDHKGRKFPPRMMQTRDLNPISTKLRNRFQWNSLFDSKAIVVSVIFRLLYL